jgi:hypothetical protein
MYSENKPAELRPVDIALLTYLILRQTEDHYINDSQPNFTHPSTLTTSLITIIALRTSGIGLTVAVSRSAR